MRFFAGAKQPEDQRLLWSRDARFARRVATIVPDARVMELDAGVVVTGPADGLTDQRVAEIAVEARSPAYGLVTLDRSLEEGDRMLVGLSAAVQQSGLAERIGMAQTSQLAQTKMLDYFFTLRNVHRVAFQPIVELRSGGLVEYECLFRPEMPGLQQSISAVVQAAIDTDRSVELDVFIVRSVVDLVASVDRERREVGHEPLHVAINFSPASLLNSRFEAETFAAMIRAAGLSPSQITLECTEQQAVEDIIPLKRQVKAFRRLGFGFAIDDAGAGYASFSLIAALRPSVIKIDREIAHGIARDDAKQALVEAFVSFGRRIGAKLLAEGIERRGDLAMLTALGVDYGQGFLIGKPAWVPARPRPMATLRLDAARTTLERRVKRSAAGPRKQLAGSE